MKKKGLLIALALMILFQAINVSATEQRFVATKPEPPVRLGYEISFDNAENGIVTVYYNTKSNTKIKLLVQRGTEKYFYNVFNNDEEVNYPLQMGNGSYTVTLYENTTGTKYRKLVQKTQEVKLKDKNSVYLQSVLELSWDKEDESIKIVDEIIAAAETKKKTKEELTDREIIAEVYAYVIKNIKYDYKKIENLDYSYTPDNDKTLETKTGICYDYSSLLASMLRSKGIPAKMVKGYVGASNVYHAWNEIYIADQDRWIVVDPTYDAYRVQNGYEFNMEKDAKEYDKMKEL